MSSTTEQKSPRTPRDRIIQNNRCPDAPARRRVQPLPVQPANPRVNRYLNFNQVSINLLSYANEPTQTSSRGA